MGGVIVTGAASGIGRASAEALVADGRKVALSLIGDVAGVQEAAVIGVKDEKWGERPMAFVVRKPDANVDADAVRAHLLALAESNRISKYAVPELDRIAFVAEIPKTSVGKIDKKVLRERNA